MKKRVFSLFTSLLIIGSCCGSIPVSAGNGAPIGVPNNRWQLDGMQTMAKRSLIGADNEYPYFSNNDYSWNKLRSVTTAVVSVTADYFQSLDTGWDAIGSIVFAGSKTNWDQHDWNLGDGSRDEDGNDWNAENNISVSNEGKVWTIKYEDPEGIYKREEPNPNGYAGICIQSFNEDTTKGWNIVGIALLDSNGKAIYSEGNVKYANNYYTFGDYEYMVYDNSVSIVGYNGNSKDIIIPSSINGYKVTEIANSAFEDCTTITSVNIPENVTIISGHAFANCYNLREVNLPRGLIHLSGYAFEDCSNIKKVTLGDCIGNDDYNAFSNSKVKELIIADGSSKVTSDMIISKSNLEEVVIPESVTSIGNYAFKDCTKLTGIEIPDSITSIGYEAFYNCGIDEITIPKSVKRIGEKAIGYYYDYEGSYWKYDDMLIKCYSDTAGESYAKANGFRYEVLDAPDAPPDDPVDPPHTHVYSSEVLRKPTCTEVGVRLLTCSCGDNRVETIPVISHNYGLWSITKYPTCHEYGEVTRKCLTCGTVDVQKVDKTNHEYKDSVTKATLTKNGSIVNKCSICGDEKSNTVIYYPKTITISNTSYVYNGKVQRPTVTVKDANGKAIPASNYTVTYQSGCNNVGKYTVKVTFKGNYSGAKTFTYTIIPKGTAISRQTAAKKGFTVAWAISATQTTGYQIQYTTDANFKSGVKTVTINKNTVVSKAITNLLAGRKYYVRVRTYKTTNKVNYFSVWSGAKTVVTK